MRVETFLEDTARRVGGKTAIVAGDARLSYADFDRQSSSLAAALQRAGLRRNDIALVFMENSIEAALSIFAIRKAGATFCPVNPTTKADKLRFTIADCRPRVILTQAKLAPVVADAVGENDVPVVIAGDHAAYAGAIDFAVASSGGDRPAMTDASDTDLAMLIYTSGSIGRPKGVMMTHRNVDAASSSIIEYLEGHEDDVILGALPLAFGYGLYQLLMAVRLGATLVLERNFAFPAVVLDVMQREKVTTFPLVPSIAALLLNMRDLAPGALPHLHTITNAAAALPVAHLERLQELFPSARLFSMYGQTECVRGTYLPPSEIARRPGSVGIAIPGTEVYVVDESGAPVAAGVTGELLIRGPHVMQGYWNDPEATARALEPGRTPDERVLHTGDLFRADDDGFLYFVGRRDDIIKTRGEKVAPKEVEAVLHTHPGIIEAVVFGVPDPVLGQAVRAMVVRSDAALTEREILRYCATRLEDFMVPRSIEFRDTLPKTETGKVSRRLAAAALEPAE